MRSESGTEPSPAHHLAGPLVDFSGPSLETVLDVKTQKQSVFLSVKMRIHLTAAVFIFLSIALSAAVSNIMNIYIYILYNTYIIYIN